jgi:EAL domain-containing protein (putative c-di-GMP-specific phosphodiesterase class I)
LANDPLIAAARLRELKATGIQVALDDFGTGYSSLGRLRDLPIDILKIDSAFCRDLRTRQGRSLAQAIVYLAKAIDLQVVGEGVELPEQALTLQRMGCDFAQGFHFGRPAEAEELSARLVEARL